jgi:hypothetical protein
MRFPLLACFVPAPSGVALARGGKGKSENAMTKISYNVSAKGKVKLSLLESVFVDFQGSNFRFQSRGRKAELGCGTR